jgi:hypothetical protein
MPQKRQRSFCGRLISLVRSQGFVELSGDKQQLLANQLQKLYEQSASNDGICIIYSTDIYLAEAIM